MNEPDKGSGRSGSDPYSTGCLEEGNLLKNPLKDHRWAQIGLRDLKIVLFRLKRGSESDAG